MAGGYPCCCRGDGSSSIPPPPPPPPPSSGSGGGGVIVTPCSWCIDGKLPAEIAVTVPGTTIWNFDEFVCDAICGRQRRYFGFETCEGSLTLVLGYNNTMHRTFYTPSPDGLWQGTIEETWSRGYDVGAPLCGYRFLNFFDTDIELCNCQNVECYAPPVPCCPNPPCDCADPCLFGEEYLAVVGNWHRPINISIVYRYVAGYGYRTEASVGYYCGQPVTNQAGLFWTDWQPAPIDCLAPQVLPLRQDQTLEFNCAACRGIEGPLIIEPLV